MQTITFNTNHEQACSIHIGLGLLAKLGSLFDFSHYSRIFILSDQVVEPLFLKTVQSALLMPSSMFIIRSGEQQKRIRTVEKIWTAMLQAGCDRKSLVINLGGGVVLDIGGFAATTYMRGVDFMNIPTTLLSQVDSSIGGKNGFNYDGIKNLIGMINQPIGVVIDQETLKTLPAREFIAGFGEIIKHGLIWDKDYFKLVTAKSPLEYNNEEMTNIIAGSCRIKMATIHDDINEQGTRKTVNFGHTIGHAVESFSLTTNKPLLHGEAISIGLLIEARLSQSLGLLPAADVNIVKTALMHAGLPIELPKPNSNALIKIMRSDKKNEKQKLNFTLLDRIGHARINQTVSESAIHTFLQTSGEGFL